MILHCFIGERRYCVLRWRRQSATGLSLVGIEPSVTSLPRAVVRDRGASDMKQPRVSVVFPEQHEETASALGRAFINDPPFKAILPDVSDPVERARRLTELF